jgi:hypothetical protein
MILSVYNSLIELVNEEFKDICEDADIMFSTTGRAQKVRIYLIDNTIVDIWISRDGRYSYHWSNKGVRDYVLRHDNAPHEKWKTVSTFPKHCHDGSESNVVSSKIPDDPIAALKYFLQRVKEKILQFKVQI